MKITRNTMRTDRKPMRIILKQQQQWQSTRINDNQTEIHEDHQKTYENEQAIDEKQQKKSGQSTRVYDNQTEINENNQQTNEN